MTHTGRFKLGKQCLPFTFLLSSSFQLDSSKESQTVRCTGTTLHRLTLRSNAAKEQILIRFVQQCVAFLKVLLTKPDSALEYYAKISTFLFSSKWCPNDGSQNLPNFNVLKVGTWHSMFIQIH